MSRAQRIVLLVFIVLILTILVYGPIASIVSNGFHFSVFIVMVFLTILSSPGSFYFNLKMLHKAPVSELDSTQILDAHLTTDENEVGQLNIHPLAKHSNTLFGLMTFGLGIWPFLNMVLYLMFHLTLTGMVYSLILLLTSVGIFLDSRSRKKAKIK